MTGDVISWAERIGIAALVFGAAKWIWDGVPAEVVIRCENNDCHRLHGLREPWARWFHVEALIQRSSPLPLPAFVREATVKVFVRRSSQVIDEEWKWFAAKESVVLTDDATLIPLVVGNVSDQDEKLGLGWAVPARRWYKTPTAEETLGGELTPQPRAGDAWVFEVSVGWKQGTRKHRREAHFELGFPKGTFPEPRLRRVPMRADRP